MLCASFPFAAFFLRPILNTTEDSIMHHTPSFFHHLSRKSLLAAAAVILAWAPGAVQAATPVAEKLCLWAGHAPVGDGKFETANLSITVYPAPGKTGHGHGDLSGRRLWRIGGRRGRARDRNG